MLVSQALVQQTVLRHCSRFILHNYCIVDGTTIQFVHRRFDKKRGRAFLGSCFVGLLVRVGDSLGLGHDWVGSVGGRLVGGRMVGRGRRQSDDELTTVPQLSNTMKCVLLLLPDFMKCLFSSGVIELFS